MEQRLFKVHYIGGSSQSTSSDGIYISMFGAGRDSSSSLFVVAKDFNQAAIKAVLWLEAQPFKATSGEHGSLVERVEPRVTNIEWLNEAVVM